MVNVVRSPSRYWSSHTHSKYSNNDALPSVKQIVERAQQLRYPALGLTDHGNMAGSLQLYAECMKAGIKPFPGTEFYLVYDRSNVKAKRYHACILAYTETGYRNLIALNTAAHRNFKYKPILDLPDLAAMYEAGKTAGLAITTGCHFGMPIQTYISNGYEAALAVVASYASWFPGATYVELQQHRIVENEISDTQACEVMAQIADDLGLPVVLTQDSHYVHPHERAMHDTLKQLVAYSDDPGEAIFPGDGYHMVNDSWMRLHHPDHYERGMEGLEHLLQQHDLRIPEMDEYAYRMPSLSVDPRRELRERVTRELLARGLDAKRYVDRLNAELEIVEHTKTSGYLLLVARVTDFCREKEIFYQARGSASGSLLCYLLGITAVDPIKWKLLMERFLSRDRTKPPDIDLDVEHDRRAEVMAMLEEEFSTLQIGTWGTYSLSGDQDHAKGSLRVKAISRRRKLGKDPDWSSLTEEERTEIYALSDLGLISGAGTHAAGVLVTTTTTEMESLVPMMYVASSKTMVSQYDMKDVERIGLVKLDVLGLKTLSVLRKTIVSIGRDPKDGLDFIPLRDSATYTWIGRGNTAGVFQLEGATATRGVKDLHPRKIGDVIAAMALYRPATMNSGATEAYVRRHHGYQQVPVRHEIINRNTAATYGILLYQEQVIAVLRDLGMQADELTVFLKAVKASNGNIHDAKDVILGLLEPIRVLCDAVGMTDEDVSWLADALIAYANYGFNACVSGSTVVTTASVPIMRGDTQVYRASANQHSSQQISVEMLYSRLHRRDPRPGRWGQNYVGPCMSCGLKPASRAGQCTRCAAWRSRFQSQGGLYVLAHKDGRIFPDKLLDVTYQGEREVVRIITEDGHEIVSTYDHRHLTPAGWRRADELHINQELLTMGDYEPFVSPRENLPLHVRMAIYERSNSKCERCGSTNKMEIAHLDNDTSNSRPSNLLLLCNNCHKEQDYATGARKTRWSKGRPVVPSRIVSMEPAGMESVYDVVMAGEDHSWVGNGIVTHNSHATVYGLTAYRCAWLAKHHPAAFYAALLSVFTGEEDKERTYRQAARKVGVPFRPVDVNSSQDGYTVEQDAIRFGLSGIKHVGRKAAQVIMNGQPYVDFADFCTRVDARVVTGVKAFRNKNGTTPVTITELREAEPIGVVGKLLEAGALRSILKKG